MERIAKRERDKKSNTPKLTDSQRLAGIKVNRDEEREFERDNTSVNLKPESKQSTAEVIDIHTAHNSESIEYPSLDDFLGDDDD